MANGLEWAGESVTGPVRSENQDRYVGDPRAGFFVIADGIGGSAGGEIAAQTVVELFPEFIRQFAPDRDQWHDFGVGAERPITVALVALSQAIHAEGIRSVRYSGMGSTVVSALVGPQDVVVVHLGDSRAYLVRAGRILSLTRDHNLARALVDLGKMSADEAARHSGLRRLTSFVGMDEQADPDIVRVPFEDGDRIVLCSDGLTSMVPDADIEAILVRHPRARDACRALIDAASEAGGRDNISVIVIQRVLATQSVAASEAKAAANWDEPTEVLSSSVVDKAAPSEQPVDTRTFRAENSDSAMPDCTGVIDVADDSRVSQNAEKEAARRSVVAISLMKKTGQWFVAVIDALRH